MQTPYNNITYSADLRRTADDSVVEQPASSGEPRYICRWVAGRRLTGERQDATGSHCK